MEGTRAGYREWLVGKMISKLSFLFVLPLFIVPSPYLIRSGVSLVGVKVEEIGSWSSEWLVGKMISLVSFPLVMHFFLVLSLYLIRLDVCLVGGRVEEMRTGCSQCQVYVRTYLLGFISLRSPFVLYSFSLHD